MQQFISYCFFVLDLRANSIRGYLSAIRSYCLHFGFPDPLRSINGQLKFSLLTLLRAVQKYQKQPRPPRLPIDAILLSRLCCSLNGSYFDSYWDCLLRTAFLIAFFGFLRIGEFTATRYSSRLHLSLLDLTLTSHSATLLLKRSKADRLNTGVLVQYFRTFNHLCPIRNLRFYLSARSHLMCTTSNRQDPLFLMPNGRALSRFEFVRRLRMLLSDLGLDPTRFSGHSFRIGAASTAAMAGVPIPLIKRLGRWSSSAYRWYINVSSNAISNTFPVLASV